MTTAQHVHTPIPRQLWIQQRCIDVENQFNGRIGRIAFAARMLPLLLILVLAYWNGLQTFPRIAPWMVFPLAAVAFYFALLVLSHRFHDLNLGGANLLQIILPAFIWLWVGDEIMTKLPPRIWTTTAGILAAWPVFVLLRLGFQRGVKASQE